MKSKVSDLIARFLHDREMSEVFGIIGSAISHVFDSVTLLGKTRIVCVHHEQAATMAAQTYYRMRGKPTAALVTAGAGSTNAITGVLSAWMDSIPLLVISGNENSWFTRQDNTLRIWGVQGYDSVRMVEGITKYAVRVTDPRKILYELEKAYHLAEEGRPGPCWIDIPMDVQAAVVEEDLLLRYTPPPQPPRVTTPSIETLATWLRDAKCPVLWLGNGIRVAGATAQALELLERLAIPSLITWAAVDLIDSDHPLLFGRAGVYGQRAANFVLQSADLVIAIGTRMPLQQVGYKIDDLAPKAKIVAVDVDGNELMKYIHRYEKVFRSDAREFIEDLLKCFPEPFATPVAWREQCQAWRDCYPWIGPEHSDEDGFINSYRFMEKLNEHFHPDQVVVTDAGTALLSGHQMLRLRPPQRLMTSLGLGEMGYGLPAAIGASFGHPGKGPGEVMCLHCDGGMMMNLQELQTIVYHQLPIKIFVFMNDGYLMIKHTQNALFGGRKTAVGRLTGVSVPDYSRVAQAFDIPAFQVRTWEDFDRVIPLMQAGSGPALCEVFMHPDQPMVPKLSMKVCDDGTLVSPSLEHLSPRVV